MTNTVHWDTNAEGVRRTREDEPLLASEASDTTRSGEFEELKLHRTQTRKLHMTLIQDLT